MTFIAWLLCWVFLGFSMAMGGITVSDWEFWAIVVAVVVISEMSFRDGRR
ncbi:MAG: hypothetical protein M0R49_08070 [Limnochordia bacterium]|nr:hypothetical protein [Limnochordia bacterium]